jgi:DNA-binding CsgD family transcriptional regulator
MRPSGFLNVHRCLWLSLGGTASLGQPSEVPKATAMIKISENVRTSHAQDGAMLLDVSQGKIYGLNPVASRILRLFVEGLNQEQIQSEISREFKTDHETVRKDVTAFLAQLAKHRLIVDDGRVLGNGDS